MWRRKQRFTKQTNHRKLFIHSCWVWRVYDAHIWYHLISIYNEAWMSFSIIFDEPQLMFGNKSSENWTSIKHIEWHVCILMEKPTPNSRHTHTKQYNSTFQNEYSLWDEQIRSIIGTPIPEARFMCYNICFNLGNASKRKRAWETEKEEREIYTYHNGIFMLSIFFAS